MKTVDNSSTSLNVKVISCFEYTTTFPIVAFDGFVGGSPERKL
ncbi:hypothetical protein [Clostridium estertheticum]|nr:hypothetical protein [Clostridium estertheticum]